MPNARTLAAIRYLRAAGPLSKRRRIPRQQQPDLIRASYYKALLPFAMIAPRAFDKEEPAIIRLLTEQREEEAEKKQDVDRKAQAQKLVDRAADRAVDMFEPSALKDVAKKFGKRTSDFQQEQLDRQVRAAMAVPLSAIEKPVVAQIGVFATVNVELVTSAHERCFTRVRKDVEEAFSSGMHPSTLAEKWRAKTDEEIAAGAEPGIDDMTENDARRIARDQIGKLNAQINQARQENLGLTGYIWRTSQDNRVRDEHTELEGESFEWDDPPPDGHPGEPIMCRCYAEPDFSPILDAVEEE